MLVMQLFTCCDSYEQVFYNFLMLDLQMLHDRLCYIFTPWPLRLNGYCCCLRLSVCLSIGKLDLFRMITRPDLSWNQQICTRHASWDTLNWYWKRESLTLTFKVILAILILGNMVCLHDNYSQIWARITKFAWDMHRGILTLTSGSFGHITTVKSLV